MSQKKVDAYKAEKANREIIMKKEQRVLRREKLIALAVWIVAVVWLGFSVYSKVNEGKEEVVVNTEMDTSALDDYLSGIATDAADAE